MNAEINAIAVGGWALAVAAILQGAALGEPAAPTPLDERLTRQFRRFDSARAHLQARVAAGGAPLSRAAWEDLIAVDDGDALAPGDLAALRERHAVEIASARAAAARSSRLDLSAVRSAGNTERFCRELPKGGLLHVHPHGTLDRDTVRLLLERVNPQLDPRSLLARVDSAGRDDAQARLAFLGSGGEADRFGALSEADRQRVIELFFWSPGTRSPQIAFAMVGLLRASPSFDEGVHRSFFARARRHGVSYVELTKSLGAGARERRRLQAISGWASEHRVIVRFIRGFSRVRSEPANFARLQKWLARPSDPRTVGIDLYGREATASQLAAGQRLYAAAARALSLGESPLQLTAHAAGEGEPRNPRDAVIMGAARLGHGVALRMDPVALEYARRRRVAIETNLTSNLRLRYVDRIEEHPFLDFLRLGLRVSLSTDDEGMLETDISRECALAVAATNIEYAELRALVIHSLETSFAEPETKSALLRDLHEELGAFEARWAPGPR